MQLTSGNVQSVTVIPGPVTEYACNRTISTTQTVTYVFTSGAETIDPPDANGNDPYTWNGTVTVPMHFVYCISSVGRSARPAPVYMTNEGQGELSAVGSVQ